MTDISTQLKFILVARDERGFVDLVQIHKLVAPVDQRETVMLLSPKKIADVRARLTTADFDPVRLDNGVFVFYELALDVIAFRRADLKGQCHKWKSELGDAVQQIICAVPELTLRVQDVFGETGIRHTRIDGKFYFAATDMAKLVLWDNETQTPSPSTQAHAVEAAGRNDPVLHSALTRTFQFG